MLTKDFNALPLSERQRLVFTEGKFIDVYNDNNLQKCFFHTLDKLKIDIIYDKVHHKLLDIIAWEKIEDRVGFLKMPVEDRVVGKVEI